MHAIVFPFKHFQIFYIFAQIFKYDRLVDRQTDRQKNRQTDRQTDTDRHRQTDGRTDGQTKMIDRETDRQAGRQAGRQAFNIGIVTTFRIYIYIHHKTTSNNTKAFVHILVNFFNYIYIYIRAYSSSLMCAIIACNCLPFEIFSNFVYFCPNFQIFSPFSEKSHPCPYFLE